MNPALFIVVIIAAILLWFVLIWAFIPAGKILYRRWNQLKNVFEAEEDNTKNNDDKGS